MKHIPALVIAIGLTMSTSACVHAAAPPAIDLRPDAPQCKMPKAKLPKLGVDFANDTPTEIKADFNGDGWCDYALGVPYPINSKMNSYNLSDLMALGTANGWKPVFNGKKEYEVIPDGGRTRSQFAKLLQSYANDFIGTAGRGDWRSLRWADDVDDTKGLHMQTLNLR